MTRAGYTRAKNSNRGAVGKRGVFVYSIDFADGFYQFKCEALASFSCLGFQATVAEMDTMLAAAIDTVYDDQKAGQVPIPKREVLECCFLAIPVDGLGHVTFATMPF